MVVHVASQISPVDGIPASLLACNGLLFVGDNGHMSCSECRNWEEKTYSRSFVCTGDWFLWFNMLTVPFPNVVENCLAGWSEEVKPIREKSLLWSKIWHEAGCPSTGVLFQLKKHAKARYKYAVRRLRRKQDQLRSRKMAEAFLSVIIPEGCSVQNKPGWCN